MVKTTLQISKPENFNFRRTIYSHGWSELPPFEIDDEKWILRRVFTRPITAPVSAEIYETDDRIEIAVNAELNDADKQKIIAETRHILRLDDDFGAFYKLCKKDFGWIPAGGAGRLIRSPTVWEDLVKTICTTNCSWSLTKKMVANLVETLGEAADDGRKTFPTPAKMAAQSADFYKDEIRAGYRATYFAELAERVAGGEINVEAWLTSEIPTAELKKQMKQIKGVGDYAAENLLKLVGRYDGLALDSFLRGAFAKKHNGGAVCEDQKIKAHYEKFGSWRGLAIWLDMTKDWL